VTSLGEPQRPQTLRQLLHRRHHQQQVQPRLRPLQEPQQLRPRLPQPQPLAVKQLPQQRRPQQVRQRRPQQVQQRRPLQVRQPQLHNQPQRRLLTGPLTVRI